MSRSLRGRLILLLTLLVAAAAVSSLVMLGLFRQSATAQVGEAEALVAGACDAIAGSYRFYAAGWNGTVADDAALRRDLTAVVQTALRNRPGIEGGIWRADVGALAYAYPTYEGSGPKTDLPEAELPRIRAVNQEAAREDHAAASRTDAASQSLLLAACPLTGPLPEMTAWTMTRVHSFAGRGYWQLMGGLAVLLAAVLAAAAVSLRLTVTWSRQIAGIETALNGHDIAALPILPQTGERELDRIVLALNEAGRRLAAARARAEELSRQVATGERLAAIGRVAAGVAHEIRNPIAAMRLRVETAMSGGVERQAEVLPVILEQGDRLDTMLRRLLNAAERDAPHRTRVALLPFLESCVAPYAGLAAAQHIVFDCSATEAEAWFDAEQMRRALDNLVVNALHAAPPGSVIAVAARREDDSLVLAVRDAGGGPAPAIREHLFEPFVTGRADGTGLGLSIVREVAEAHGGSATLADIASGTVFEIRIPWQKS